MSSPAFSAGHFQAIKTKENAVIRDVVSDRSLFIVWAGEEHFGGGSIDYGGSVVTEKQKAGITENFGRI